MADGECCNWKDRNEVFPVQCIEEKTQTWRGCQQQDHRRIDDPSVIECPAEIVQQSTDSAASKQRRHPQRSSLPVHHPAERRDKKNLTHRGDRIQGFRPRLSPQNIPGSRDGEPD